MGAARAEGFGPSFCGGDVEDAGEDEAQETKTVKLVGMMLNPDKKKVVISISQVLEQESFMSEKTSQK